MMVACGASSVAAVTCRLATPPELSGSPMAMPSPSPKALQELKDEIMLAADNNDESLGVSVCNKLEKLNLTKDDLESTRIGGVVNDIRKRVAERCPKFSTACRSLIKQWRKQTETYTRAGSSCGGSNGVTPSMISPAMRRLLTPQTPHRLGDGSFSKSQVSSPRVPGNLTPSNGSTGNLVAQAVEKVQQLNGTSLESLKIPLKRKPDVIATKEEAQIKRSKSALIQQSNSPPLSISAVRRDAQSTAELVAQLSENLPQQLAPDLSTPKSSSVSPNSDSKSSRPPQLIMFPEEKQREKRKYTKRAAKFFKNSMEDSQMMADSVPTATESIVITKVKVPKKPGMISGSAKKVDWYAALPSVEELQKRAQAQASKSKNVTKPYIETVDGRELVCLPFVDVGIPDVMNQGQRVYAPQVKLQNPDQFRNGIDSLETRLVNIKRGIEELLLSLNANDKVSWPALLSKAASLSAELSSVQAAFKRPVAQNSQDDATAYFRNQLVIPHTISPDINPALLEMTEHRVGAWNHETCPLFLKTKLPPEVEKETFDMEPEPSNSRLIEQAGKQIASMNKHLDMIITHMQDQLSKWSKVHEHRKPTFNPQHTDQLVRVVHNGDGIKKQRPMA
ncbi:hypothetical protein FO519_007102 [Halicephalobus sp. NKZ332]|nr:hypothetical protein FO519_007102 [Halicephalobus sp. NKZ332]